METATLDLGYRWGEQISVTFGGGWPFPSSGGSDKTQIKNFITGELITIERSGSKSRSRYWTYFIDMATSLEDFTSLPLQGILGIQRVQGNLNFSEKKADLDLDGIEFYAEKSKFRYQVNFVYLGVSSNF